MKHLCRDFLTLTSSNSTPTTLYLTSLFLTDILGYVVDSHANFNLLSFAIKKSIPATINLGSGKEYYVQVSNSNHNVSASDINRILTIRSTNNPKHNSGLFRVSNIDAGTNSFIIDYRSSEYPPSESVTISLYKDEHNITYNSGSNGLSGVYNTSSSLATASRCIFTHNIGYKVRLCLESSQDITGTIPAGMSIAPGVETGIYTSLSGDFIKGNGYHLHTSMFFDTTSSFYRGTVVGISPRHDSLGQFRFICIGDDNTGNCSIITRNVNFVSGGNSFASFGISEDYYPGNDDLINKLYVVGQCLQTGAISFENGIDSYNMGVSWMSGGYHPTHCLMSSYGYSINTTSPFFLSSSYNTQWLSNTTELLNVELISGISKTNTVTTTKNAYDMFSPRRLGKLPHVYQGTTNYLTWSLSPDKKYLHTINDVYLEWQGPSLTDDSTGPNNFVLLNTSSYIEDKDDSIWFGESVPLINDPYSSVVAEDIKAIDANRFVKTYSYFKQPKIETNYIK